MLQGTIVENSLTDPTVLGDLSILKSWPEGSWKLHQVQLDREQAIELATFLADGPWYMHFWEPGTEDVLVVFKDKTFDIKYSDKSTWEEAVAYGKSTGVPEEQLDFLIY
ncbi:MAG: hypothetical protein QG636_713 [Patescibacteria group bacterium]|nr:hypothetical protein [Patescibacteria group bacterium]